jgi:hypothetical protein
MPVSLLLSSDFFPKGKYEHGALQPAALHPLKFYSYFRTRPTATFSIALSLIPVVKLSLSLWSPITLFLLSLENK